MPAYQILITKKAEKDFRKLIPALRKKALEILAETIAENPFQGKKLLGELAGHYSIKLTYKDRILYRIDVPNKTVYIKRTATHYGE